MSQTTLKPGTLKSQSFRFICVWFCSLDWTCPLVLLLVSPQVSQAAAVVWEQRAEHRAPRWLPPAQQAVFGRAWVSSWGWLSLFLHVVSHFSVVYHSYFSNKTHIGYLISLIALIIILFLWEKAKLYDFIFTCNIFSKR